jgi:MFS family permease
MTVLVTAGSALLAGAALLVVGFALSPVIPTVLSLAGRSAPGRAGAAVSLVTTLGYSAFVLGPPVVGALAGATSLRTAMSLVIVTTAAFAVLGRRVRVGPVASAAR